MRNLYIVLLASLLLVGTGCQTIETKKPTGIELPIRPVRPKLEEVGTSAELAETLAEVMAYAMEYEVWADAVEEIYSEFGND